MRLFFFLLISSFFLACTDKPVEKITARHASGAKKTSLWVKKDGTIRKRTEWYGNGIKELDIPYKKNVEDGNYTRWSSHGDIIGKGTYKNGLLDGKQETFFIDRRLHSRTFYSNGKRNGKREEFYFDGQKKSEETYRNDSLVGLSIFYHKNGKISQESTCHFSEPSGSIQIYSESGKLLSKESCRFGKRDGERKIYYPGGSLQSKEFFKNEKFHGEKIVYFADGKKRRREFWNEGIRDSLWCDFSFEEDTLACYTFTEGTGISKGFCLDENQFLFCSDSSFSNNLSNGKIRKIDFSKGLFFEENWEAGEKKSERIYYLKENQKKFPPDEENLKLASESFWKNGLRNGLHRNWYRNGNLQDSLNFIDGERFGDQMSFDSLGNITRHTREAGKNRPVIFFGIENREGK